LDFVVGTISIEFGVSPGAEDSLRSDPEGTVRAQQWVSSINLYCCHVLGVFRHCGSMYERPAGALLDVDAADALVHDQVLVEADVAEGAGVVAVGGADGEPGVQTGLRHLRDERRRQAADVGTEGCLGLQRGREGYGVVLSP
jgi:hypothetical protein